MSIAIQLSTGEVLTSEKKSAIIGQDAGCDFRVTGLQARHARIRKVGDRWLVESLGKWPLKVGDGAPARTSWLRPGDTVWLTEYGPRVVFGPQGAGVIPPTARDSRATPLASPHQEGRWETEPPPLPPYPLRRSRGKPVAVPEGDALTSSSGYPADKPKPRSSAEGRADESRGKLLAGRDREIERVVEVVRAQSFDSMRIVVGALLAVILVLVLIGQNSSSRRASDGADGHGADMGRTASETPPVSATKSSPEVARIATSGESPIPADRVTVLPPRHSQPPASEGSAGARPVPGLGVASTSISSNPNASDNDWCRKGKTAFTRAGAKLAAYTQMLAYTQPDGLDIPEGSKVEILGLDYFTGIVMAKVRIIKANGEMSLALRHSLEGQEGFTRRSMLSKD